MVATTTVSTSQKSTKKTETPRFAEMWTRAGIAAVVDTENDAT